MQRMKTEKQERKRDAMMVVAGARRGNAQTLGSNAESGRMSAGDTLCAVSAIRAWTGYRHFGRPGAATRANVFASVRVGKMPG
mmetsp:Transcript_25768/g.74554  ORF Transcript_25768/g.74554 Transcript_25768/m.74554 type:complete len:83 (-) Transcript_25768:692-940(-)